MIKEALAYIVGLAGPQIETVGGVQFSNGTLTPLMPPAPKALELRTLGGLVEYLSDNSDDLPKGLLIQVDATWVAVAGPLVSGTRNREIYAVAKREVPSFVWGRKYPAEEFVIALQTLFDDSGDRAKVLALIGAMSSEHVDTSTDDGVSQTVAKRVGTNLLGRGTIQNPVMLAPHRTFAEVAQPSSPFILRVHQDKDDSLPQPALYECDNGAWKLAAIASCKAWLVAELADINLEIPVIG